MSFAEGIFAPAETPEVAALRSEILRRGTLYRAALGSPHIGDVSAAGTSAPFSSKLSDLPPLKKLASRGTRGAFAIEDKDAGVVHLARDASGDHPLFYTVLNGMVAYSSAPSGLFPLTGAGVDLPGYAHERRGASRSDRTAFERIRRVLPGEHVVVGPEGVRSRMRVAPLDITVQNATWNQDDVERARHLLDGSVRECLSEPGIVGCHLSGGRDSSAISAIAARLAPGRIRAYTGAPAEGAEVGLQRGRIADESGFAAAFAQSLGIPQRTIRPAGSLFGLLGKTVRTFQSGLHPICNIGWMLGIANRAREDGCGTMLVGGLGNVTLNAGGLPVLQDHVRGGRLFRLAREISAATSRDDVRLRGALAAAFRPWMPSFLFAFLGSRFADFAFPDPDRFVRPEWRGSIQKEENEEYVGRRDWRAEFARDFCNYDPGIRRLGMLGGFGLVERDPYADRELAQLIFQLPASAFLDNGRYKPFADRVLASDLPLEILHPTHRGLQGAEWLARFDIDEALAIVEEARASSFASDFLELDLLAREIAMLPRLREEEFGKQIGHGWHVMEALMQATFLIQLDHHSDAWGMTPFSLN